MESTRRVRRGLTSGLAGVALVSSFVACSALTSFDGLTSNESADAGSDATKSVDAGDANAIADALVDANLRYCERSIDASYTRFCVDFDEPDANLAAEGWSQISPDDDTIAALESNAFASAPNAATLTIGEDAGSCPGSTLVRTLSNPTATSPKTIYFGADLDVAIDGFFGSMSINSVCFLVLTVHGNGTTYGLEFEWTDPEAGYESAFVNYPTGANAYGRFTRVDFAIHFDSGAIDFSIDGAIGVPDNALLVPPLCRSVGAAPEFRVGPTCQPATTTTVDNVSFGVE